MEEFSQIQEVLTAYKVASSGPIVANPAQPGGVYISVQVQRDASGRQAPSHKTLAEIRHALEERGFKPQFFFIDEHARLFEEGLRGSLISSFPNSVRNSFISMEGPKAQIWLEAKREITAAEREDITTHIKKLTELYSIRSFSLSVSSEANLATNTEILSLIRYLSPAKCESIRDALVAREFDVPSLSWINHRLDAMRKTKLVVRMPDRTYALTAEALHRLGTIKGRHSPDVSRLLALARRGS